MTITLLNNLRVLAAIGFKLKSRKYQETNCCGSWSCKVYAGGRMLGLATRDGSRSRIEIHEGVQAHLAEILRGQGYILEENDNEMYLEEWFESALWQVFSELDELKEIKKNLPKYTYFVRHSKGVYESFKQPDSLQVREKLLAHYGDDLAGFLNESFAEI